MGRSPSSPGRNISVDSRPRTSSGNGSASSRTSRSSPASSPESSSSTSTPRRRISGSSVDSRGRRGRRGPRRGFTSGIGIRESRSGTGPASRHAKASSRSTFAAMVDTSLLRVRFTRADIDTNSPATGTYRANGFPRSGPDGSRDLRDRPRLVRFLPGPRVTLSSELGATSRQFRSPRSARVPTRGRSTLPVVSPEVSDSGRATRFRSCGSGRAGATDGRATGSSARSRTPSATEQKQWGTSDDPAGRCLADRCRRQLS